MKRIIYIMSVCMALTGFTRLTAQYTDVEPETIFDALKVSGAGKGEVIINQDPAIRNLVGSRLGGPNIEKGDNVTYVKVQGYRVQVFSDNQRNSKDEAFRKEREVKDAFPEIETYVTYNAPFWRLRVGDYGSQGQANTMLKQLSDAFPRYGKEMYVVKEEVKIPLHDWDY